MQVWASPHTFVRRFPVTAPGGVIYWPEIAYPYITPVFTSASAGLVSAIVPIAVITLAQLWVQSFDDFASALLGLTYSLVTGSCCQVVLKKTIGGLRPHFLAVCKPIVPPADRELGEGFHQVMFTREICTGDARAITNALESFPSGHAEVAFAGFGYLSIYLFAHLRITGLRRRGSHWKMILVVVPLLFATYLSATLVLDYYHYGHDVCFGALIGWIVAFLGYRTVFKGVLDARWNTVPYLRLQGDKQDSSSAPGSHLNVPNTLDREREHREIERVDGLPSAGTGQQADAANMA